jgi:hypothetical protein
MNEQTQDWYTPANGVSTEAGDIGLRNVLVVADDEEQATILAALSNRGSQDDSLLEVTIGDVVSEPVNGAIDIPAKGYATVGPDADRIDVTHVDAAPGRIVEVTFRFAHAPRTTVDALVQADTGPYADTLPDSTPSSTSEPPQTVSPNEGSRGTPSEVETSRPHASPRSSPSQE